MTRLNTDDDRAAYAKSLEHLAIAKRLKDLRPARANKHATVSQKHMAIGRIYQWEEMVKGLADFFAEQNENFDREKWVDAIMTGES